MIAAFFSKSMHTKWLSHTSRSRYSAPIPVDWFQDFVDAICYGRSWVCRQERKTFVKWLCHPPTFRYGVLVDSKQLIWSRNLGSTRMDLRDNLCTISLRSVFINASLCQIEPQSIGIVNTGHHIISMQKLIANLIINNNCLRIAQCQSTYVRIN